MTARINKTYLFLKSNMFIYHFFVIPASLTDNTRDMVTSAVMSNVGS